MKLSTREDIIINAQIKGFDMRFNSTFWLFSPKNIDEWSAMLIEDLEIKEDSLSLDIGCGYWPIGLTIAKLSPKWKVHLVDKDFVAIDYAKINAVNNRLDNTEIYLSNAFSNVPDMKFDVIVSNLPAKVSWELLEIIMIDAKAHLKKWWKFYVVVISGLKEYIKRNFKEIFGNYKKLSQGKTYTVAVATNED